MELVPAEPRVFPVGRLDTDTEGLLLLTNDGDLAHRLTHPRFGVEKEYLAEVEGSPSPADLRRLREGVELDDGMTAPAKASLVARRRGAAGHPRGPQPPGPAHVRGGRPPGRRLVRTRIGPLADRRSSRGSGGRSPWTRSAPSSSRRRQ